jgi:predicted DNA-binding antitoxin AbrB/MazE fold protein
MTLTVQAVYENGVLRPTQPLPLQERQQVQVTVQTAESAVRDHSALLNSYVAEDEGLYDAYPAG